jgi:hypothetical protein
MSGSRPGSVKNTGRGIYNLRRLQLGARGGGQRRRKCLGRLELRFQPPMIVRNYPILSLLSLRNKHRIIGKYRHFPQYPHEKHVVRIRHFAPKHFVIAKLRRHVE